MLLTSIDWIILVVFFAVVLMIGLAASYSAGKSTNEYFLGGRSMPWWLLGVSMVACTFSADTPNLVTGMVRENGVAKNWAWWSFLITGMVTVFIYAKLWRRSKVLTDLQFYEIRYSGKPASFLRGFRAIYLGLFFNCLIMGTVTLAIIKIGAVMFGFPPVVIVIVGSIGVVIYTSLGGLKGVIWADFFQYSIATFGAIYAAVVSLNQSQVGGLSELLNNLSYSDQLNLLPDFKTPQAYLSLLIIPIAVQWWAVWYPGAEPGGGGYIAQRMLASKNEKNAVGATLLFNFAHYALRPWPWIIVALCSTLVYPDLESIRSEFPQIEAKYLGHDIAYPAMLTKLGPGWLGLVVASIVAAYMSTIGTHLNWGSSYLVNDFYQSYVRPQAPNKELILVARISTIVLMFIAGILSLTILENATQAFNILLLSGAGSGAIYLLRWFWWRINAWTEIVTMVCSFVLAILLTFYVPIESLEWSPLDVFTTKLLLAVTINSAVWIIVTYCSPQESEDTLISFYKLIQPGGPGWNKIAKMCNNCGASEKFINRKNDLPYGILLALIGCVGIYCALFAIGNLIYGNLIIAICLFLIFIIAIFLIFKLWSALNLF